MQTGVDYFPSTSKIGNLLNAFYNNQSVHPLGKIAIRQLPFHSRRPWFKPKAPWAGNGHPWQTDQWNATLARLGDDRITDKLSPANFQSRHWRPEYQRRRLSAMNCTCALVAEEASQFRFFVNLKPGIDQIDPIF
jgi:hypothetical protein